MKILTPTLITLLIINVPLSQAQARMSLPGHSDTVTSSKDAHVTMARSNPQRSGAYEVKGLQRPSLQVWRSNKLFNMPSNNDPAASPVAIRLGHTNNFNFSDSIIAGKTICFRLYFGDSYLFALDAQTGRLKWTYRTNKKLLSYPAASVDTIFVGAEDGYLRALDSETGKEKWKYSAGRELLNSPLLYDNTVYVTGNEGNLYAVSVDTGKESWVYRFSGYATPPALNDNVIYFGRGRNLFGIDAKTGKERSRFK